MGYGGLRLVKPQRAAYHRGEAWSVFLAGRHSCCLIECDQSMPHRTIERQQPVVASCYRSLLQ